MATIDDKVVSMSFESSKFESGVNSAISALDKLKSALNFPQAGKGLDDVNAAAKRVDLSHIANGVDDIKGKLGAMSVAALAIFANIAQKAVSAGAAFVKSFTLDPIKQGFQEYAINLNAIQTILANTQASGATLKDVNNALNDLNHYSDKTIYNFSQMAKNIGTFTAAGVDLKTSTEAIKGIANLAALSGSNADQASTAMYQLSQAIAAGQVHLQDWNSVVNAGMGGTVFQRALATTAENMGTLKEGTLKLVGPMKNVSIAGQSFRQSLQTGPGKASWLTSKVLTTTLKQFTGDLTDAQLKADGFNAAQIKAIQQTAKTAMHAATEVKTLSQVLDVAKETAGSGWAQTWQIIFGDFGEAKKTFTNLSNAINGLINTSANARNKVLADWKALGGRTVLIDAIKTAFHNLGLAIQPIKDAFKDIFPATTGKQLYDLTVRFKEFADALKPSPATVEGLRKTFRGLFAVLDIGKQIISGIFTVFGELLGVVHKGSGGILDFTGSIGDFLVSIDKALKKGDRLHNFFLTLGHILAAPLQLIGALSQALSDMFSGFSPGGFFQKMGGLSKAMSPFQKVMEGVSMVWNKFLDGVSNAGKLLQPAVQAIVQLIEGFGTAIGNAASGMNFDAILQVIRTGLFGALVLMAKNFFGSGSFVKQLTQGFSGGVFSNITKSFGSLQGTMVSLQNNIKAKTLKEIAIAIGILSASVLALSLVDPKKLNASLGAMTLAFGELLGAMALLTAVTKTLGFIKLPIITASLILLAGAIDVLTIAVIALSHLSWEQLLKGLAGVGTLLGIIVVAAVPLSASSGGLIRAGIGISAIAVALNLLALAVRNFGSMNLEELGKGLGGVAVGLGIMVKAMTKMPAAGMIAAGAGITAMAVGLKILASAVQDFGQMDIRTIAQGLIGIATGLGIMVFAMTKMPTKSLLKNAIGLDLMAGALKIVASAIESMGAMSVSEIAKGLIALGGAMLILAGGLELMSGAMGGALALGVVAGSLALLVPVLITLGKQSWGTIAKGLGTLAIALGVFAGIALLLSEAIPVMIGLGAALLLLGGGLALAGAGIFLISTGLSALVVAAPTGVGVIVAAFIELEQGIVKSAKNLILGLLEIVKALADTAPQFVDALIKILNSLLDVIIQASPKIAQAFDALIALVLTVIHNNQSKIIQAGFDLLVALLTGIKNNIPQLVTLVVDIITRLLNTIAGNLGRIITAGLSILISLVKGIVGGYTQIISTAVEIIAKFVQTIANNVGKVVTAGISILTKFLQAIADGLPKVIKAGVDIIVNLITGVGNAGPRIITAAVEAIIKFVNALAAEAPKLADAGAKAIIAFMNGVSVAIDKNSGPMGAAGARIGVAIVEGLVRGLAGGAGALYDKAHEIMDKAMSIIHKIPVIGSPSKVTTDVGKNIVLGLIKGMNETAPDLYSSATVISNGVINAFNETFQTASPSKVMMQIGQYVGQGFADGLRGSADNIRSAFTDLNNKLTESMAAARETIAKEQDKLDKLREAKKPDAAAIAAAQKIIAENEDLLARSTAGHTALVGTLNNEKRELIGLVGEYNNLADALQKAQDKLKTAKQIRDDYQQSLLSQYDATPDISGKMVDEIKSARDKISAEQDKLNTVLASGQQDPQAIIDANNAVAQAQAEFDTLVAGKVLNAKGTAVDQLATYTQALTTQTTTVAAYQATLQQLRKLGLDDATYQKLLTEGPADQQFANQLLAGGKTAVASLNTLDTNLQKVSKTLATRAAKNLYQAGVDSAQGLVNGLDSKKDNVSNKMEEIANEMVATMKRVLKIKSPSEAFLDIGTFSMQGMAKGFSDGTKIVTDAVDQAAQDALLAMKKSMSDISSAVTDVIDPNPVITPILDLTQIRDQANKLSTLTAPIPITAAASYGQASLISSQQNIAQADQTAVGPGGTSVKFEQNNYSPESLTEIEIYRQTKNQISQLKSVLALT